MAIEFSGSKETNRALRASKLSSSLFVDEGSMSFGRRDCAYSVVHGRNVGFDESLFAAEYGVRAGPPELRRFNTRSVAGERWTMVMSNEASWVDGSGDVDCGKEADESCSIGRYSRTTSWQGTFRLKREDYPGGELIVHGTRGYKERI